MRGMQLFVIVIFLSLIISGECRAQNNGSNLTKRQVKFAANYKAGIWEVVQALAAMGIPIGYEAREHSNIDTDQRLILESGTLEVVLNSAVRQDKYYAWKEIDGVINIYPVKDQNQKFVSILSTTIGPINITVNDTRSDIVDMVSNLFYSQGGDAAVCFRSAIGKGNRLGLREKLQEGLYVQPADLRTVLNKLIKEQPYMPLWSITRFSNGRSADVDL